MKRFLSHCRPSENPTLLVLNNHNSHTSCEVLDMLENMINFSVVLYSRFASREALWCFSLPYIESPFWNWNQFLA